MIRGGSVVLVPFDESCITDEYLSWLNDRALMRFSKQRLVDHSRETSLAYLRSFQNGADRFWSIRRASDRLQIGTMTAYVEPHDLVADLGILIGHRDARGRGSGREAWGLAMGHLFGEGLRKTTAGTVEPNRAMRRICEAWGMRLEGVRRAQELVDGEPTDVLLFGLLREEWISRAGSSA